MTRNANNSMRKMALATLTVMGLTLSALGSVGCDETAGAVILPATGLRQSPGSFDKGVDAEKIWHPRGKIWHPRS